MTFAVQFCVAYDTGRTGSTGDIRPGRTRVIDLALAAIADGAPIWPVVHTDRGGSNDGDRVSFARNGETANYEVQAIEDDFRPSLIDDR